MKLVIVLQCNYDICWEMLDVFFKSQWEEENLIQGLVFKIGSDTEHLQQCVYVLKCTETFVCYFTVYV